MKDTYSIPSSAAYPDAEIRFRASDMVLQGDSDAAYLAEPDARSRAGGFHFLGSKDHTQFNGPIHVLAKTIKSGSLKIGSQQPSTPKTAVARIVTKRRIR